MDELAQLPRFALLIIAEQRRRDLFLPVHSVFGRMDTGRLSAARASGRNDLLSGVAVPIQIFLHMGNDLVPLAHLDTASRHQFQILNEGEVMEACPGYRAAIDLHRVKDGYRSNFPCAAGRPFNRAQDGFIGVILKLERKPVLIVMPGPSAGLCVGGIVVGDHDAVNGYVVFLRVFPQVPDTGVHIELRQRLLARQILANGKAELFDGPKPLRLPGIFLKALQHIESHKGHMTILAGAAVQQSDRAGSQIAPVFIRFAISVPQRVL